MVFSLRTESEFFQQFKLDFLLRQSESICVFNFSFKSYYISDQHSSKFHNKNELIILRENNIACIGSPVTILSHTCTRGSRSMFPRN